MKPLVSVVIPTYNSANTLCRCIKSAINQTIHNLEIVIVDDGSTDDTEAVIQSFDDDRIQFYQHDENRGGSAARNTGIKHSTGKFIAFLDSDDSWLSSKLEKQIKLLETRSDDWIACYCNHTLMGGYTNIIRKRLLSRFESSDPASKEGGQELIKYIFTTQISTGGASTLLVKRNAVEKLGGFDESFPRYQDWEFFIRLLKIGKVAYHPEELVIKYETGSPRPAAVETAKEMYFEKFGAEIGKLNQQGYDIHEIHSHRLGIIYIRHGQFSKGFRKIRGSKISNVLQLMKLGWAMYNGITRRIRNLLTISTSLSTVQILWFLNLAHL